MDVNTAVGAVLRLILLRSDEVQKITLAAKHNESFWLVTNRNTNQGKRTMKASLTLALSWHSLKKTEKLLSGLIFSWQTTV